MTTKSSGVELRRLAQLATAEWRLLAIGTVFLAISSGALLIFPQVIKRIIDEALVSKDVAGINQVALLALAIFVVQSAAGALRYFCFTLAGERIVVRLRQNIFTHLLRQDIAYFDAQKIGEIQSRLSSDATILQNTLSVNISMLVRNAATAVGGLGMLLYTSPQLAMALLGSIPPIVGGVAVFGKKIRTLSRSQQDAIAVAGGVANETLSGIRIVRALGQEVLEGNRYQNSLNTSFVLARRKISTIGTFIGVASLLGSAAVVAVLWYGSVLVVQGSFSIGALTSFMLYTLSVAVAVGSLGGLWTDFMSASGASKRIFEILDQPVGVTTQGGHPMPSIVGEIDFRNVRFSYPTRPEIKVLRGLNFRILPGESVALVGPSGGGKSTIAAMIARFYDPTTGQILIDGIDLSKIAPADYRSCMAIVPQDPTLFSVSIAENIRFGFDATNSAVESAAKLANAWQFVSGFPNQFQTLIGERGIQLSGGQRQRIAIARAALRDPRILILDEATSALDAESEGLVQEALERLMQGRTTLIIAHRLSTVRKANRILVIDSGQVVQSGSHEQLMADQNGIYRKLVDRQLSQN